MTRAASFLAGVALAAFVFLAGLVALVLLALGDQELDEPEQCPAVLDPIGGLTGPPLRCQDFAGHPGEHRHANGDHTETTWEDLDRAS